MATRSISMRWEESLLERLRRRAQVTGSSTSAIAQRYVDEGLRMDEHPGVVFRDGPAGRRAKLVAGPDVWEVVQLLADLEVRGDATLTAAADAMGLDPRQTRTAWKYYGAYPDEVHIMVEENERAADEAAAAWRTEQQPR